MIKSIKPIILITLITLSYSEAQFGNIFEQFFNQGNDESNHHHGHHEHHHHESVSSSDKLRRFSEQSTCSNYLCPTSFECVSKPTDCPCLDLEDIKCLINDSSSLEPITFFCTRAPGCNRIENALQLGTQ
ncbi:hypothetical protein DFH28DRAFT_1126107 [Melampsora americana]|nr:hypothetical protein DFH28DRAFT_1126107 [Melampsora americana]